jgi:molecular chaperone IbpA
MVTSRAIANLFDRQSLAPHFVGFDSLFDRLNEHYQLHTPTNFPPYNIRKLEENKWQVEVALAGYDKKDIEVKTIEGNLIVATVDNEKDTEDSELVHRGISQRKFSRTWSMADDAVVQEAKMEQGMLYVKIERVVPDEKKPKLIKIS